MHWSLELEDKFVEIAHFLTYVGENRQLDTDEPVEFEK